jgi:hypothetical protein
VGQPKKGLSMSDPSDIRAVHSDDSVEEPEPEYELPKLIELGRTRELTHGSSSSGAADANSQYYW